MKKKFLFFILFIFFIISPSGVEALSPAEITNRNECPNIELAEAKEDGTLNKIECYENYQDAKNIMNITDNDNLVIIEKGMIIDAKYAVVDYDIDYPKEDTKYKYMDIYISATSSTTNGYYIRGGSPDEAAMIDVDYNTKRVKIKIAGLTGWIDRYYRNYNVKAYDIIPIVWIKTPQHYQVTQDSLIHCYAENIYGDKKNYSYTLDRKPTMLNPGKYYSYDGHYFYTSIKTMLQDYKNGNYNQAINKDNSYYNYYQYLSFRTLTSYNSDNINQFIADRAHDSNSKMLSTGEYFIKTQNNYGVNAALMMAIGINESNWGKSDLAKAKNNLFGLNAIDATPGESANYFKTVGDCIGTYGYAWLSYWYLQPGDFRYKGPNLGNKMEGLNYKYASDPFWAEKAAHYYYELDKNYGFQDYNSYQIAVLNDNYNGVVFAKKTPGGDNVKIYDSSSYYQYTIKDTPIVVLEEVEGPEVNGNKIWYKIQADPTLDGNLNYIGSSTSKPRIQYSWGTSYVYVPAAYFTKVNIATGNIPEIPIQTPEPPVIPEKPTEPESPKEPEIPIKPETPVEPETPPAKPVSSIVTEANYKYKNGNIFGISPNTSIKTIKSNLTNTGGVITITDANGNTKESGNIGTGDKVNITSGTTETLTVLIYGDTNGDGNISAVDYVKIKNHIMGTDKLNNIYVTAADVNKDGNISAVDYVNIKNYIMGTDNVIKN